MPLPMPSTAARGWPRRHQTGSSRSAQVLPTAGLSNRTASTAKGHRSGRPAPARRRRAAQPCSLVHASAERLDRAPGSPVAAVGIPPCWRCAHLAEPAPGAGRERLPPAAMVKLKRALCGPARALAGASSLARDVAHAPLLSWTSGAAGAGLALALHIMRKRAEVLLSPAKDAAHARAVLSSCLRAGPRPPASGRWTGDRNCTRLGPAAWLEPSAKRLGRATAADVAHGAAAAAHQSLQKNM